MNVIIGTLLLIGLAWIFAKLLAKPNKPAKPVAGKCFMSDRDFYAVSREFR